MIRKLNRIIHQIWLESPTGISKDKYDDFSKTYKDYAKKHNWEYYLWDDESSQEFVKKEFPEYFDEFNNLDSVIKKADCLRYMVLYIMGGLYVDMDSYLKGSLEKFIRHKYIIRDKGEHIKKQHDGVDWNLKPKLHIKHDYDIVVGQEKTLNNFYYDKFGLRVNKINNAVIFAKERHPLFIKLIEDGFKNKDNSIYNSFGVNSFMNILFLYMNSFVSEMLDTNKYTTKSNVLCLPYIYFYEMDVDDENYLEWGGKEELINDKRQIIVHKFDSNWDDITDIPKK